MAINEENYVDITSNVIGGEGGGGVGGGAENPPTVVAYWGDILGNIQDQADLIALLESIAPEVEWGAIVGNIADQADLITLINNAVTTAVNEANQDTEIAIEDLRQEVELQVRNFSGEIVLDAESIHYPYTINAPTPINVTGFKIGASSSVLFISDGVNIPTVTGADEWDSSFGFLNTDGVINLFQTWFDGLGRRFVWSQQMTPVPIDDTPPVLNSASVTGSTLTLTYNEALNTTSPATSAYSVVGAGGITQQPSNVTISGAVVTLTLATPAVGGNTVTINYTVPGSNPIRDLAGNAAAALTNQAVTVIAGATILELTTLNKLTQGSGATDNVYTADASGVTNFEAYGRSPLSMAGDGLLCIDWASSSNGAAVIGFDATNTVDWITSFPDIYLQLSTASSATRRGANSGTSTSIGSTIAAGPNARYGIRRIGTTVTLEYSTDAGANWTVIYTAGTVYSGPLYAFVGTQQANTFYRPRQIGFA